LALTLFQGYAVNAVDQKGRLSIPAPFRDAIRQRSENNVVVLAPHEREQCLIGYDAARSTRLWNEMEKRFEGNYGPERDDYIRITFGTSEPVPFDDNGRIVLSQTLRDLIGIERQVFFSGMGDYFELWNPETLLEQKGSSWQLSRIVKSALAAKGGRA
jgi:MraZ protein